MKKGFTLIELLITITIFSIVGAGFLELFGSAFREQRKTLNLQYLLSNTSYVSEYMSRALRMAKKDGSSGSCTGTSYLNYAATTNGIRFLNYDEKCQEFKLDSQNNQLRVGISTSTNPPVSEDFMPLTPLEDLVVQDIKFEISGAVQPPEDYSQPKVTFILKIKTKELKPQELNLQTTVSQRDLDVKY